MQKDCVKQRLVGCPPIFWINLERSTERKERLSSLFEEYSLINYRVPAVDGLERDYFLESYKLDPRLSLLENATTVSHLLAIKKFYNSGAPIGIIMEDDVSFDFIPYWGKKLTEYINSAPPEWEILQLCYIIPNSMEMKNILMSAQSEWLNRSEFYFSALAYVIKREVAAALLQKFPLEHLDLYMPGQSSAADCLLYNNAKTFTFHKCLFTYPENNNSTIHGNHLQMHKESKEFAKQQWIMESMSNQMQ